MIPPLKAHSKPWISHGALPNLQTYKFELLRSLSAYNNFAKTVLNFIVEGYPDENEKQILFNKSLKKVEQDSYCSIL
jgi:hypothetical protein